MTYSRDDARKDSRDAARADEALALALERAAAIGTAFDRSHTDSVLHPHLEPLLTTGAEEQPLIVFSLVVDVDPDTARDEYPAAAIDALVTEARHMIEGSEIDDWDWLVKVNLLDAAASRD